MIDPRNFHVTDRLRDGTPITIRAIRPDDKERLVDAFAKLDPETVYTRFFTYKSALSDRELKHATEADFDREVGLLVTLGEGAGEIVIGGGRYVAYGPPGSQPTKAEVSFTVEEDYQGQGLARRLLQHLAGIARARGITHFEAEVLPMNKAMLGVFARSGLPMTERRGDGVVHVTLALG